MKLVHLVGFIMKKFVTMQHGHMNVKYMDINLPEADLTNKRFSVFYIIVYVEPKKMYLRQLNCGIIVDYKLTTKCDHPKK